MNKAQLLIKQNNELRKQLNFENNAFYSDFLVYMRLSSFSKSEIEVENILLEILQDIIDAQNEGINANEYFGKDAKLVADDILKSVKINPKETLKLSGFIVFVFIIMTLLPSLIVIENTFDLGAVTLTGIYMLVFIQVYLKHITNGIYLIKRAIKNKIVRLIIYYVISLALIAPVFLIMIFVKTPIRFQLQGITGVSVILVIMLGFTCWWLKSTNRKVDFPIYFAALLYGSLALIIRIPVIANWFNASSTGKIVNISIIIISLLAYYLVNLWMIKNVDELPD